MVETGSEVIWRTRFINPIGWLRKHSKTHEGKLYAGRRDTSSTWTSSTVGQRCMIGILSVYALLKKCKRLLLVGCQIDALLFIYHGYTKQERKFLTLTSSRLHNKARNWKDMGHSSWIAVLLVYFISFFAKTTHSSITSTGARFRLNTLSTGVRLKTFYSEKNGREDLLYEVRCATYCAKDSMCVIYSYEVTNVSGVRSAACRLGSDPWAAFEPASLWARVYFTDHQSCEQLPII
jgi:hypothetical protein